MVDDDWKCIGIVLVYIWRLNLIFLWFFFLLIGLRGLFVICFFYLLIFGKFYEVMGNLVIILCYEII